MNKYRGKRKDNGKWVFGSLIDNLPDNTEGKGNRAFILDMSACKKCKYSCPTFGEIFVCDDVFPEVIPETVGMGSGCPDKNGKEIFQGDLIRQYMISRYEQRSFPEYVDLREWKTIETFSEVVFEDGCFVLKPTKQYRLSWGDTSETYLESTPLAWRFPPDEMYYREAPEMAEGAVIVEGNIELYIEDIEKLKIFEVIGAIYDPINKTDSPFPSA